MLTRNMLLEFLCLWLHFGAVSCWSHVSSVEFQKAVKENDLTLVAFVAPWTEPCKSLESEWEAASKKATKPLISIDCTADIELCDEHHVISYPAIRVFKNGQSVGRYRGTRKVTEIVAFVSRAFRPVVSTVSKKNSTTFKSSDEAVFLANPVSKDIGLAAAFTELAMSNFDRFVFGIALPGSGLESEVPADCVVCYKTKMDEQKMICGESKLDVLENFMETATAPLVGELTRRNELKYLKSGKSMVYIFGLTEKERSKYKRLLSPLAKVYEEYLNFVTIDALEHSEMVLGMGLKEAIFPALAVQNPSLGQVFPFDQSREITLEDVEEFILNIVQGNVQPAVIGAEKETNVKHSEL